MVIQLKVTIQPKNADVAANYQPKTLSGNSLIIYYAKINDDIVIAHLRLQSGT